MLKNQVINLKILLKKIKLLGKYYLYLFINEKPIKNSPFLLEIDQSEVEQESILKQEIEAANEERKTQLMEEKQKELEAKKIEEQEELEKKQKETGFCIFNFNQVCFFLYNV